MVVLGGELFLMSEVPLYPCDTGTRALSAAPALLTPLNLQSPLPPRVPHATSSCLSTRSCLCRIIPPPLALAVRAAPFTPLL